MKKLLAIVFALSSAQIMNPDLDLKKIFDEAKNKITTPQNKEMVEKITDQIRNELHFRPIMSDDYFDTVFVYLAQAAQSFKHVPKQECKIFPLTPEQEMENGIMDRFARGLSEVHQNKDLTRFSPKK